GGSTSARQTDSSVGGSVGSPAWLPTAGSSTLTLDKVSHVGRSSLPAPADIGSATARMLMFTLTLLASFRCCRHGVEPVDYPWSNWPGWASPTAALRASAVCASAG